MKKLLILAFAVALSPSAFSQILNPGFETGDFSGWATFPAAGGSYFGVTAWPHSGSYSAFLAATSGLPDAFLQTLEVTTGTQYTLTFWLYNDDIIGQENVQVTWEGVPVFNGVSPRAVWTQYSYTVTATSNLSDLRFSGYDGPDAHYVDDVSLTPVPEPATFAAFGLGVAAIGLLRRRRIR